MEKSFPTKNFRYRGEIYLPERREGLASRQPENPLQLFLDHAIAFAGCCFEAGTIENGEIAAAILDQAGLLE